MQKKIIEIGYILAIYISVMTIPYVYWAIYHGFIGEEHFRNEKIIITGLLMLCHGLTLRKFYKVYVDKYSDEYHDK